MTPILECRDLTKMYGKNTRPALNHVNLKLNRGRIIGLLGPNGSGKTTLIKLANGLLAPTSGGIWIDEKPVGVETHRIVSYLPERTYLDPNRKICEYLNYFSDFYPDFDRSRAVSMLTKLGLSTDSRIGSLSKGTQEKVQLVLVMSRQARLYCLDEPIAGVDPASRDYILSTILNNYDEHATILISTHLISDVENILDEVIFLKDGKVLLHDSVEAIRFVKKKSVDELFREVFQC